MWSECQVPSIFFKNVKAFGIEWAEHCIIILHLCARSTFAHTDRVHSLPTWKLDLFFLLQLLKHVYNGMMMKQPGKRHRKWHNILDTPVHSTPKMQENLLPVAVKGNPCGCRCSLHCAGTQEHCLLFATSSIFVSGLHLCLHVCLQT